MLEIEKTVLIIVDVQGKLAQLMYKKEMFFNNLEKLIKGIQVLEIPILWAEQLPDKLGPTIPQIKNLLSDQKPITKNCFSCYGDDIFVKNLKSLNRKQTLVAGMETHVCVYQTAVDLVNMGYEVQVVADAVSSRTFENKHIGLEKIREMGVSITSVETALFELLKIAQGSKFKKILNIIK